jgi:hypothetical protein
MNRAPQIQCKQGRGDLFTHLCSNPVPKGIAISTD